MRTFIVPLIAIALAAPLFAGTTTAEHPNRIPCLVPGVLCPDLWTDGERFDPFKQVRKFSATDCDVVEGSTVPGTRTLLRFRFTTPNTGLADLVVGAPNGNAFEFSACHNHWHFKDYADYRLWTPEQYAEYDTLRLANPGVQAHEILDAKPDLQPIRGDKRGFCVIDLIQYTLTPPKYALCNYQGISVGWADEYAPSLTGQYIDITGVPSGTYVLEAEVNSEQLYEESNYDNNRAAREVTI